MLFVYANASQLIGTQIVAQISQLIYRLCLQLTTIIEQLFTEFTTKLKQGLIFIASRIRFRPRKHATPEHDLINT